MRRRRRRRWPWLVLLVDGVFDLGHAALAAYGDLPMRLAGDDVAVSVITVGPLRDPATALGYVGDAEALRVVVEGTGGALLSAEDVGRGLVRAC